jgi:Holliday junction resolvase-like predicted endonuclease
VLSQGDQGEHAAVSWLMSQGWQVALPIGNCSDWDVAAEFHGRLQRVQVKTTRCLRNSRWDVTLCTRGGNQSWSGLVKHFAVDRCDHLYAHTACGRRWFIPSEDVGGGSHIVLGGPKYATYEVEPGAPLTLE